MSQNFDRFGKYILLEKLAAGGMAEVFLARALGADGISKFLAVKRILPQYTDNPEFIAMFKAEAKIAINLSHSNIVQLFEIGASNNQLFIVMEYVEGKNLRQILNKFKKSKETFGIDQIVYMIREIAGGLDHAHRCLDGATGKQLNITHRDMSPQNIMVSYEGELKVIDFGIAKAETDMDETRAGTLKGKFGYMSPEQAEGQPVDLRTDIFSLGIILWELLASDRLFIANNEINTLRKIRDCRVPNLRKINPNVPPELEKIVYKALARDRNLRYQTAAAFHRELNLFLNRQYPDFTNQDFSAIIKSHYADEILDNRQRLINYAQKINNTEFDLSDGQQLENNAKSSRNRPPSLMGSEASLTASDISNDVLEIKLVEMNEKLKELNFENPNTVTKSMDPKSFILDQDAIVKNINKKLKVQPASPMTLNDSSLENIGIEKKGRRSNQKKLDNLSTEDVTNRSRKNIKFGKSFDRNSEFTISRIRTDSHLPPLDNNSKSFSFMGLLMTIGLFAAGLIALNQLFPSTMAPVMSFITGQKTNSTNLASRGNGKSQSKNTITAPAPALNIDSTPPSVIPDPSSLTYTTIKSKPSGAEIFINGKTTKKRTPSIVKMAANTPLSITLKKFGYKPYTQSQLKFNANRKTLNAQLLRASYAYLNIDVSPPLHADIYVDNVKIEGQPLPLHRFSIPANQNITVKAVNPLDGSTQVKQLSLKSNQSRNLIFKLTRPNTFRKKKRK